MKRIPHRYVIGHIVGGEFRAENGPFVTIKEASKHGVDGCYILREPGAHVLYKFENGTWNKLVKPPLTYLQVTDDIGQHSGGLLHISHLMQYVSAYEICDQLLAQLGDDLLAAIARAKETHTRQIVDQDGEMFLAVSPSGHIALCLEWKHYRQPLPAGSGG